MTDDFYNLNVFVNNMLSIGLFFSEQIEINKHSVGCPPFLENQLTYEKRILQKLTPELYGDTVDIKSLIEGATNTLRERIHKKLENRIDVIRNQILVLYHAVFEYHVSGFLEYLFRSKPNLINIQTGEKDRVIPEKQIIEMGSYEKLVDVIVIRELKKFESLNYEKKEEYLNNKLGLTLNHRTKGMMILEINQLRNRILHDLDNPLITDDFLFDVQTYMMNVGITLGIDAKKHGIRALIDPSSMGEIGRIKR